MSLQESCKTVVSVDGEPLSSFQMKVGVHQGSARVHFYIKVLIEDVRYGSLIELLYAEDLVLFGESLNK